MDWQAIHYFFEVLSVYAGLAGISLYGLIVPLRRRERKKDKKSRRERREQ